MIKPVRFNPEYRVFKDRDTTSLRSLVESYVYEHGIDDYLIYVHASNKSEPAYAEMVEFRKDIDRVFDIRTNIGESFLDGAALAIDSIKLFTPDLLPDIHESLVRTRAELSARHLGTNPTVSDEKEFVSAIRMIGHELAHEYAPDYQDIMADMSAGRGYTYVEQHLSVMHGFTFVMHAAGQAYERDMVTFANQADAETYSDDSALIADFYEEMRIDRENRLNNLM